VESAEAACAAPRARSSDGSVIVHNVAMSDAVNSKSISVKPASPRDVATLLIGIGHLRHFSALLPLFDSPKVASLRVLRATAF
jgi:hypothetical protein